MSRLLRIEACSSELEGENVPTVLRNIVTPLEATKWASLLAGHPDRALVDFILRGLQRGFRIGYNRGTANGLKSSKNNHASASDKPDIVSRYIDDELVKGRLSVVDEGVLEVHCSPFGVIPKKSNPNKWRLILDLSCPHGNSVNDGISKELASLSYVSIDEIVTRLVMLGRGAVMAKMDIKQAYRNIPVHPGDSLLLGMRWQGKTFVDRALPFGLRSAPLIFTAVADALQWIMEQVGATWVRHYVDDYITIGAPGTQECTGNISAMLAACAEANMPIEPEKNEGPATTISFLGLELDSIRMEVRLPLDKLERLKALLETWKGRKAGKKREVLSLIGLLSHASKAVRPGRAYIRRLIDLSTVAKHLDHYVRINKEARADIEWWRSFLSIWNGTSLMFSCTQAAPDITLTSDASGNWGCGAYLGREWFMLQWSESFKGLHITVKELAPIVLAAMIWGQYWKGKTVRARCDNAAVVAIVNAGTSKSPHAMNLVRCLSFLAATFDFRVSAVHLSGIDNVLADALSRNNLPLFLSLHPQANQEAAPIPSAALDLILLREPDWTTRGWTDMWTSTWSRP